MKLTFFGADNPPLDESLSVYILSFLEPKARKRVERVSKLWQAGVKATEHTLALLPIMQRVPQLRDYPLPKIVSKPISGGMTNGSSLVELTLVQIVNHKIEVNTWRWVLRVAGKGSSAFIKRKDEAHNAKQAASLQLNVIIDFFDEEDGLQLTRYFENSEPLDKELLAKQEVIQAIALMLKQLHQSDAFHNSIDVFARNSQLLKNLMVDGKVTLPAGVEAIAAVMTKIEVLVKQYCIKMVPCHNDPTPSNFLWQKNTTNPVILKLIDYEYSGNYDGLMDLVYFISNANYNSEQAELLLTAYYGELNEKILAWYRVYQPVVEWWITIWSWTQLANQADVCDSGAYQKLANTCYEKTKQFLDSEEFKHALEAVEENTLGDSFNHNNNRSF